jgi:thioredoxin reductase (NADPH)
MASILGVFCAANFGLRTLAKEKALSAAYDLIVIGEGIAGLSCAARAKNLGLRTATTEGNLFGGLVINIAELQDYAAGEGSGVDVASALMEANADAGIENLGGTATAIESAGDEFVVKTDSGQHSTRAVVIASGARLDKLGVPGEEQFDHRGVSQCADCDGPMFQGEHVVVVGGGDSAFQEAVALSNYAGNVTLLLRGAAPRARLSLVERAREKTNISIVPDTRVVEIVGKDTVDGVRIESGGNATKMDCAGVFVFVGLTPNSEVAPLAVKRDAKGAIETDSAYQTALRGVYAVGAVRAGYSGRLDDAVAEARAAAENVARQLAS